MHASILKNASKAQVSGSKLAHLTLIISKERQPKRQDESMSTFDALSLSTSRCSTPESFSFSARMSTLSTHPFSTEEHQGSRLDESPSPRSSYSQPLSTGSRSSTPFSQPSFDSPENLKYKEELQKLEAKLALLNEEKQMIFKQLKDLLAAGAAPTTATAASSDDFELTPAAKSPSLAFASTTTTAPFASLVDRLPAKRNGHSFGQPLESELSDASEEETNLRRSLPVSVSIPATVGTEPLARALPLSAPAILPSSIQNAPMLELTKRPLAIESVIEDLQPHKLQRVEV